MAFWNAPQPTPEHPKRACKAVLACKESLARLYASPAWKGLPSLVTRFGVHEAEVMVGHFGAPTRLSYTALGDGVNLAARLEPLCKQYGVTVLVSETIAKGAGTDFAFRRIDRVAVKGKARGIDVYELLGKAGEAVTGLAEARRYEEAFDAYLLATSCARWISSTSSPTISRARCCAHAASCSRSDLPPRRAAGTALT